MLMPFSLSQAIVALTAVAIGSAEIPRAGAPRGISFEAASPEAVLLNTAMVVIDGTIEAIVDQPANTNATPPRVKIRIDEIYKGQPAEVSFVETLWNPPPHDIDTGGRAAELAAWNARPILPPPLGSRWILAGNVRDGEFHPYSRCRYPYMRAC